MGHLEHADHPDSSIGIWSDHLMCSRATREIRSKQRVAGGNLLDVPAPNAVTRHVLKVVIVPCPLIYNGRLHELLL